MPTSKEKEQARRSRYYQKCKASGKCWTCKTYEPVPGKNNCQGCITQMAIKSTQKRKRERYFRLWGEYPSS